MASSSGNSAGSTQLQNPDLIDQMKRKRMQSNRESARRSRMRKQKHVDDLMSQINEFRKGKSQLVTTINLSRKQLVQVEAENDVLRAQMGELSQRLDSLNQILVFMETGGGGNGMFDFDYPELVNNPWNLACLNQQPIMASADVLLML